MAGSPDSDRRAGYYAFQRCLPNRFGSLIRAYQLIGYTPQIDYSFVEINRYLARDAIRKIVQTVITPAAELGVTVEREPAYRAIDPGSGADRIPGALRSCAHQRGSYAGCLRFEESFRPDLTIAVAMDETKPGYQGLLPLGCHRPGRKAKAPAWRKTTMSCSIPTALMTWNSSLHGRADRRGGGCSMKGRG